MAESGSLSFEKEFSNSALGKPQVFASTRREIFNENTPKRPYLTFTLGPGRLERLVVKIWSNDQGWRNDDSKQDDPYAGSHTWFAFDAFQKTAPMTESWGDNLYEFQRNVRASSSIRCHINEWNLGIPVEEDDCNNEVDGWMKSLEHAEGLKIGVFASAQFQGWVNEVWKMEVHLYSKGVGESPHMEYQVGSRLDDSQNQTDVQPKTRRLTTARLLEQHEATKLLRQAYEDTPENHEDGAAISSNPLARLFFRNLYINALVDIEQAIRFARVAVEVIPKDHPDQAGLLGRLTVRLGDRFMRTGAMEDLEEAIRISRHAIEATPERHSYRVSMLSNLGRLLGYKHSRTSATADLEEAISIVRQAIKAAPKDHPDQLIMSHNLAIQLHSRFTRTGSMEDLEESIMISRQVANATPDNDKNRPARLSNLSIRLSDRFLRTGVILDLEESVETARLAAKATPKNHPDWPGMLNNLGNRLGDRYSQTGEISDLEEAISLSRQGVEATPAQHPLRASMLNNLAHRVNDLFSHTRATADIEEAVRIARQAVEATANNHLDRPSTLNTLGHQLNSLFSHTGAVSILEEAISVTRQAVKLTPDDQAERATMLNVLGFLLYQSFMRTATMEHLLECTKCHVEALHCETSTISRRIAAGRQLLWMPNITQCGQCMFSIAQTTVNLIPLSAPQSLLPAEKKQSLSQAVGVASDAAAVALQVGQGPVSAIQLLETGRGVLASSLQNMRTDLSLLHERHSKLASLFHHLCRQLDTPTSNDTLSLISTSSTRLADQRHRASRDMTNLLNDIRNKPGFERFLLPATEHEIQHAAESGPIVILNVSAHRCDALIIELSGIRSLELPSLSKQAILEQIDKTEDFPSLSTLSWLWDVVVGPVLEVLGFAEPPVTDKWPHVWWIPTGPLSRFPLHAAGYHTQPGGKSALDRVISSYSSSIKAIINTRQQQQLRPSAEPSEVAVLVSMTDTPGGLSQLHYASEEIDVVQSLCIEIGLSPIQPQLSHMETLSALSNCKIFHFAGHGGTHSDPLQSKLYLEDWKDRPLTVASLLETQLSSAPPFLAYLSACGTGQNRDKDSADEGMHLTSAFQLAGFRHVIGTLWEVDDKLCVDMARMTYKFMGAKRMDDASVSAGLHHATRALRDRWVDQKLHGRESRRDVTLCDDEDDERPSLPSWAPYVHYGV